MNVRNPKRYVAALVIAGTTLGLGSATAVLAATNDGRANSTPSFGRIPPEAFSDSGPIDLSKAPDFVETLDQKGDVVGYVRKGDLQPTAPDGSPLPTGDQLVFAGDGKSLVGRMVPGKGFVRNGQRVQDVPDIPTWIEERQAP